MNITKIYNKSKYLLALSFLAALFFIGTSLMNLYAHDLEDNFVKWSSPDEAANYIFAKYYGQEGKLAFEENYNLYTKDIMHPRSFRSDHGMLKPVSFFGIILIYGKIVSMSSYEILPFLTPIIAAIGIIFYYLLIKNIFGKINGFISAILLSIFPVYIFYTARSMFHNVLFTVLLIIGLYFLIKMGDTAKGKINLKDEIRNFISKKGHFKLDYRGAIFAALAGVFIGLSIITRTSELIWLLPMLLLLWLFNIKRAGIFKLIIFLSFLFLSILPALYYNQILYGSFYSGGYPEMNNSIYNISNSGLAVVSSGVSGNFDILKETFVNIFNTVFHFGFHPKQSAELARDYFVDMFYWLFWPAVLGLILFFQKWKKHKKRHWLFLFLYFFISTILILYYGSWKFHDNPDPNSITIGNSYTRYWLPVYLGAIPFASLFIMRLSRAFCAFIREPENGRGFLSCKPDKAFFIKSLRAIILSAIALVSINFVLTGSSEGLVFQAERLKQSRLERNKILELTEHNSVVITRYHDKLLFPERKVIVGLFDDPLMIEQYKNIVHYLPVYYYNFTFPPETVEYLNSRRLKEAGLRIDMVSHIEGDFTLYRLSEESLEDDSLLQASNKEVL
jgi:hypothetical protein